MPNILKKRNKLCVRIKLVEREIVKKSRELVRTKSAVGLHKILNYYEKLKKRLVSLQGQLRGRVPLLQRGSRDFKILTLYKGSKHASQGLKHKDNERNNTSFKLLPLCLSSSVGQSTCLLSRGSQVRILSGIQVSQHSACS